MAVPMRLDVADRLAADVIRALEASCERIAVAGDIRLCRPSVATVVLVAIPRLHQEVRALPLFDEMIASDAPLVDQLDAYVRDLEHVKAIRKRNERGRVVWTPAEKRIAWPVSSIVSAPVDVISTTPAQWGLTLVLRTGPRSFVELLSRARRHGGLLPDGYDIKDGALWRFDDTVRNGLRSVVETLDEHAVFAHLGLAYRAPLDRTGHVADYQLLRRQPA